MQIGVTFPQYEMSADPRPIREYARTVENLGYKHVLVYDHLLGADPCGGYMGYPPSKLIVYLFSYRVL